ncbi:hypothetical protein FJY63_14955 [Candidatus Sumerlaeota bacterium]|nr:hypothetical protein [Candidatus Sumerlaeota bacterium]
MRISTPRFFPKDRRIQLELSEPPAGVTVQNIKAVPSGLVVELKADGHKVKAGFADNLIVEAYTEMQTLFGRQPKKTANQGGRVSLGVLPAIPFEVVRR